MEGDVRFVGSIPALYDRHLGPWLFAPFAADLARRLDVLAPARLLETAAGTGIVTRALAAALPETSIVATDLNQPMIDYAAAQTRARNVTWRQADAQALPFGDGEFDAVTCQFGVMFFPDKARGFAEARRVLRDGGHFVFSVWDRIEDNGLSNLLSETLAARFPDDPPRFLNRGPFGCCDRALISRQLADAGFADVAVETVALRAPTTAHDAAVGLCQGSPLSGEIEARAPGELAAITAFVERELAARVGTGVVETPMQGIVFSAAR
jgi:ubiquinone/menaquinone biosynthesis C-methylase UbiE